MLLTANVAGPLREYVVARLAPLTEAEPAILADYTMALLKHDVDRVELARLVSQSLSDFFKPGHSSVAFTDALLGRLDELVADDASAPFNQGVKRAPDHRDDAMPAAKHARLDGRAGPRPIPSSVSSSASAPPPSRPFTVPRGPFQGSPRKKPELCRDYHCAANSPDQALTWTVRGFCARGDACVYIHEPSPSMPAIPLPPPPIAPSAGKHGTTLAIENIPPAALSIESVRAYFSRFGGIEDVQLDPPRKRALVTFASREAAKAAHSSPAAVFDNRFVKVFWPSPTGPPGLPYPGPPQIAQPVHPAQHAHERRQRELAELAERSEAAVAQVEGSEASSAELQATLDSLRSEAASLGVDASGGDTGGFSRGRGRGRGSFRARGRGRGRGRGSMTWTPQTATRTFKLDLRPRALQVELEDEADPAQTRARLEVRHTYAVSLTPQALGATSIESGSSERKLVATFESHDAAARVRRQADPNQTDHQALAAGTETLALKSVGWQPQAAATESGGAGVDTEMLDAPAHSSTRSDARSDDEDETGWKR